MKRKICVMFVLCFILSGCSAMENNMNKNVTDQNINEATLNNTQSTQVTPGSLPDVATVEQIDFTPKEINNVNLSSFGDALFKIEQCEDGSYMIWILKYSGVYEKPMCMYMVSCQQPIDSSHFYEYMVNGFATLSVLDAKNIHGEECAYLFEAFYNMSETDEVHNPVNVYGSFLDGKLKLYNSSSHTNNIEQLFARTIERYDIKKK